MVVPDVVPARDNPKSCWSLVSVEQVHARNRFYSKVALDSVLHLGSVLDEKGMSTDVVDEIMLQTKVIDPMNGYPTIPTEMNGAVVLVTPPHIPDHVPMYCVAS